MVKVKEMLAKKLGWLLFLTVVQAELNTLPKKSLSILKELIESYSILEVYIAFPANTYLYVENYVNDILTIKDVSFNIHTDSSHSLKTKKSIPLYRRQEFLVIISNSSESFDEVMDWQKLYFLFKGKLVAFVLTNEKALSGSLSMFQYSNMILFMKDQIKTCNLLARKVGDFTTTDEFIAKDPEHFPEGYWPKVKVTYEFEDYRTFPLLVHTANTKTGVIYYLSQAFEKYVNNRLLKTIPKSVLKNRKKEMLLAAAEISTVQVRYPLTRSEKCFMLPVVDEIKEEDFLREPFKDVVWCVLFICIIYFTIILRVLVISDIFISFMESLTTTFGSVYKGVQATSTRNRAVYLQIFLYGFIIWNLHSAKLSSYLVTPDLGRALKTVDDIKRANVTVWGSTTVVYKDDPVLYKEYYPSIYNYHEILGKQFIYNISTKIYYEHLMDFDTTYGYFITDYMWSFFSKSQMLLNKKLFTYSRICPYAGFVDPLHYIDPLNNLDNVISFFYLRVQESGLDYIWEQFTYNDVQFTHRRSPHWKWRILGFKYFWYAWISWIFGIVTSLFAFVIEKLFWRFLSRSSDYNL